MQPLSQYLLPILPQAFQPINPHLPSFAISPCISVGTAGHHHTTETSTNGNIQANHRLWVPFGAPSKPLWA